MSLTAEAHIPLTTTFVPPSSCISDYWIAFNENRTESGNNPSGVYLNLGPTTPAVCLPSGWAANSTFSPGICPEGYHTAASSPAVGGTTTETIATCCPVVNETNYYSIRPNSLTPQLWWSTALCQWTPTTNTYISQTYWQNTAATADLTTDHNVFRPTDGTMPFNAYGVVIAWQSTDFTTPPATAVETATATATGATTDNPHASSGLSTGAEAGIGVGVAVAVVFALAFGFFFLRRRRRQRNLPGDRSPGDPLIMLPEYSRQSHVQSELPADPPKPPAYHKPELEHNPVYEMEGSRHELG